MRTITAACLLLLTLAPSPADACNPFTVVVATPQTPVQKGMQLLLTYDIEQRTGLTVKVESSSGAGQSIDLYLAGTVDLLVVTGDEPAPLAAKLAGLPGRKIEAAAAGVAIYLHPELLKLFPKMVDLVEKAAAVAGRLGREKISLIVDKETAKAALGAKR